MDVGRLRVVITGDDSDVRGAMARTKRGLDDAANTAEKNTKRVSGAFGKMGGFMRSTAGQVGGMFAGAMAVDTMVTGFQESVDAAASMTEATSKVDVVFGKSADAVKNFANTSAVAYRMSSLEATQALGTYGNLFRALGVGEGAAGSMSVGLTKLAGDMASFNDATSAETLDALRAGLTGETEPLKRFGVNLSEAAIQAQAVSDGLVKNTVDMSAVRQAQLSLSNAQERANKVAKDAKATDEDRRQAAMAVQIAEDRLAKSMAGKVDKLTAAQKAQAVYNAVMTQTKLQQGDAARTSETATAKQAEMTATISNLKVAIGTELMPIQEGFLNLMLTKVIPALETGVQWYRENEDTIKKVGVAVGIAGGALLTYMAVSKTVTAATAAWSAITSTTTAVTKAGAVAQWLMNAALSANPIGLLVTGLGLLVVAIGYFLTKTELGRRIVKGFGEAFGKVGEWIGDLIDWVKANWPTLLAVLTGPIGLAVLFITRNFDTIKNAAATVVRWVTDKFNTVVGFVTGLPGRIASAASGMWDGIKSAFRGVLTWIAGAWNALKFEVPSLDVFGQTIGGFTLGVPPITVPALATGGVVTRPTLALVGEAGPEAVVPLTRAGRVAAGIGGGNTYNLTVQVDGGMNAADVRREARAAGERLLRELRDVTRAR